jgi:hypothetical protein
MAGNSVNWELVCSFPIPSISKRPRRVISEGWSVGIVTRNIEDEGSNWVLLDGSKISESTTGRDPWSEGYETKSGAWEYDLGGILWYVQRPLGAKSNARYWRVE